MSFTDYSHGVYGMSAGGYVTYQRHENLIKRYKKSTRIPCIGTKKEHPPK